MRKTSCAYMLHFFKEESHMHEYEIFIEEINPCGGEKFSKKTLIEAANKQ